jgi:hypothetical protein
MMMSPGWLVFLIPVLGLVAIVVALIIALILRPPRRG